MKVYDPSTQPDPKQWLELDEQERIGLVVAYHRKQRIKLEKTRVHAAFHVIVENQIAEGLKSTERAITRLLAEGLSRHEALHAVMCVLVGHLNEAMSSPEGFSALAAQAKYEAELDRLTVSEWHRISESEGDGN
ncbi:MAG: hypothetical protein JNL58_09790 [Planctomyces sp.]|nr:hypothetical protein [Planctomyces sp.]